jgi:hypothetical protein
MAKRTIAALVILETDDPRLDPDGVSVSTVAGTSDLRRAVIENLPNLTRVVMLMTEPAARLLTDASKASGISVNYPPRGFVPPTRD